MKVPNDQVGVAVTLLLAAYDRGQTEVLLFIRRTPGMHSVEVTDRLTPEQRAAWTVAGSFNTSLTPLALRTALRSAADLMLTPKERPAR